MPLYDILNEFQKGSSHMAAVVRPNLNPTTDEYRSEQRKFTSSNSQLATPLLEEDQRSKSTIVDIEKISNSAVTYHRTLSSLTPQEIEDGEVIGIITLEDVFEELLQVVIAD